MLPSLPTGNPHVSQAMKALRVMDRYWKDGWYKWVHKRMIKRFSIVTKRSYTSNCCKSTISELKVSQLFSNPKILSRFSPTHIFSCNIAIKHRVAVRIKLSEVLHFVTFQIEKTRTHGRLSVAAFKKWKSWQRSSQDIKTNVLNDYLSKSIWKKKARSFYWTLLEFSFIIYETY